MDFLTQLQKALNTSKALQYPPLLGVYNFLNTGNYSFNSPLICRPITIFTAF